MLNRTPPKSSNPTINSFRKKRQLRGPIMMYGAIGLVLLGFVLLVVWLTRPGQPLGQYFATDTPTATVTSTVTNTSTPTATATITETSTATVTATPSEPFPYTIQEGDSLEALSQRFNLGPDGILLILDENPTIMTNNNGVIFVGQEIRIPVPGTTRATSTPIPGSVARGTRVEYQVLPGDTLAGIAARFNSIQENILTANPDIGEDANALQVGQILQIPVNLITPTATLPPTSTPITPTVPGGQPTAASTTAASTRAPGGTGTATCSFNENAQYITQLETLINEQRTTAGLPALTLNAQLTTAAKNHAVNMLCNNYLSHIGLDGSTPEQRVEAAGFNASVVAENLYALHPAYGGNPQAAVDWWMSDPVAKADLLKEDITAFGVSYVSSDTSLLGGYFVVVAASP